MYISQLLHILLQCNKMHAACQKCVPDGLPYLGWHVVCYAEDNQC